MTTIDLDAIPSEEPASYDWPALVNDLNGLLRLKTTPIGMKMFATAAEMEAVPKIRRPQSIHTTERERSVEIQRPQRSSFSGSAQGGTVMARRSTYPEPSSGAPSSPARRSS